MLLTVSVVSVSYLEGYCCFNSQLSLVFWKLGLVRNCNVCCTVGLLAVCITPTVLMLDVLLLMTAANTHRRDLMKQPLSLNCLLPSGFAINHSSDFVIQRKKFSKLKQIKPIWDHQSSESAEVVWRLCQLNPKLAEAHTWIKFWRTLLMLKHEK